MKRRSFLKVLTSVLGLGALATLGYPLFRFLFFFKTTLQKATVIFPLARLPVGASENLLVGETPAIVIHKPTGFIVLSRVCTHLGCLVNYDKARQLLICPCHNGIYDLNGNVVSGPPPRPLPTFSFKIKGDNIEIVE
jgi:cytochrome b6-f complex iron-sulfur subunit